MKRRSTYRLTVRLDIERDADLIAWLVSVPPGSRSALIRDTLRSGLRQPARWEPVDIDEMRREVAEERARALAGRPAASEAHAPANADAEKKYGAKLDRMLGGLAGSSSNAHEPDDPNSELLGSRLDLTPHGYRLTGSSRVCQPCRCAHLEGNIVSRFS